MAVFSLKKKILILLALLVLLAGGIGAAFLFNDQLQFKVTGKFPIYELEGEMAPDFAARKLGTSEDITLKDLRGKPTLLVFFASFCPTCKVQMPEMLELLRTSEVAKKANIWAVNGHENARLPVSARTHVLGRYMLNQGWEDIPTLVAPVQMQEAFKLSAIPSIVVLDAEGRVTYVGLSDHRAERLEALLKDAL